MRVDDGRDGRERLVVDTDTNDFREATFRDRLADRAAVFGVGIAVAAVVGLLIGALLQVPIASALGYTIIVFGVAWLLGGGLAGGGYTVYGIGCGIGRNHHMRGDRNRQVSEGLRAGYDRPIANPEAFWQSVGGFLYVAIGFVVVALTS
jgi:hypothetical protein